MNCKQGDLAVILRSAAGNEGKIVRCVRSFIGSGEWGRGPRWVTDPPVPGTQRKCAYPLDAVMRPIRDSDGEDEILRLVGLPAGTPQAA